MQLIAGLRIAIAHRFQVPGPWPGRLWVNTGVDAVAGGFFPRPDWRRALDGEVAILTRGDAGLVDAGSAVSSGEGVEAEEMLLFALPDRLRLSWWEQAEDGPTSAGAASAGFVEFARKVDEFLRFKGLPLPPSCLYEVVATAPGQDSTRLDAARGGLAGLAGPPDLPAQGDSLPGSAVGGINLGDEDTWLVFLNVPAAAIDDLIRARAAGDRPGGRGAPQASAREFLAAFPTYPLVRLLLHPGEGYLLPAACVASDGNTRGKRDLDVVLRISAG